MNNSLLCILLLLLSSAYAQGNDSGVLLSALPSASLHSSPQNRPFCDNTLRLFITCSCRSLCLHLYPATALSMTLCILPMRENKPHTKACTECICKCTYISYTIYYLIQLTCTYHLHFIRPPSHTYLESK